MAGARVRPLALLQVAQQPAPADAHLQLYTLGDSGPSGPQRPQALHISKDESLVRQWVVDAARAESSHADSAAGAGQEHEQLQRSRKLKQDRYGELG